jgi:hypothetical protein
MRGPSDFDRLLMAAASAVWLVGPLCGDLRGSGSLSGSVGVRRPVLGAHSAPARERRGEVGPPERPSRGVGRSPTLVEQRVGEGAQPPRTPRASAPADLTGYWVAVITEDWRFRMVTPPSRDYAGVPLNPEGTKVADAWDLARDVSAGEQCRAFGAAGIMRMPVRLHVTWQDDTTLKMEIDNGNQVRFFRFDRSSAPPGQPDWQGTSLAEWETVQQGQAVVPSDRGGDRGQLSQLTGTLKVETSRMKPGYLRRNGIPYSATATLTEFFDRTAEPNGDSWLILTSIVEDPVYLSSPFMLTTHFKREPDGAKFNPRPCELTPPVTGTAR